MADLVYHNIVSAALNGTVDLASDTLRVALFTSSYTPNADHTQLSDCGDNQVANGNGYTSGGVEVTGTITDDDGNNRVVFDISNPEWTASGGSIGPFRYGVLYDDTSADNLLIYCFDFGSDKTADAGAPITIVIDSAGLFRIS